MSTTSLPGYALLGCTYQVKNGYYANPVSVNTQLQLFDFGAEDGNNATLYGGQSYTFPQALTLALMAEAETSSYESMTSAQLDDSTSVSLGLSGSYGAFSAEVSGKYSSAYTQSTSFYHLLQRALIQSFKLTLPAVDSLRGYLKADVKTDIDTMNATALVAKYGTHFLWEGIYGGRWDYSQSMSKYSTSTATQMEANFQANYGAFVSSKVGYTSQVDSIQTSEQSDAYFHCYGGNPETLTQGYTNWAGSVRQGSFVLVEFTNSSLQPLSVLAGDSGRANEILAAIEVAMANTVNPLTGLVAGGYGSWEHSGSDKLASTVVLPDQVLMTGIAASFSQDKVVKLAVEGLNLSTNTRAWYSGETGSQIAFNTSDWQNYGSVPAGYVVTGLGVRCNDGKFKTGVLYYQAIDALNLSNNYFLSDGSGDPQALAIGTGNGLEIDYHPAANNGAAVNSVGLKVGNDNVTNMVLGLVRLYEGAV